MGEVSVGEDMGQKKIPLGGSFPMAKSGDAVVEEKSSILEEVMHLMEIGAVIFATDMLDDADRRDLVELFLGTERAVVAELDPAGFFERLLTDPLLRECCLLDDRDGSVGSASEWPLDLASHWDLSVKGRGLGHQWTDSQGGNLLPSERK